MDVIYLIIGFLTFIYFLHNLQYKNEKRSSLYGGEERFGKRMMDMDRFGKRMMDMDRFGKRMMDEDRFGKRMMDEDRFGKRRRKRSSSDSEDILEPSRY